MIYADNAATTALDLDAFEVMKPFFLEAYGNPSQPYGFSRKPKKALREARETIADCIGANPDEIFFTSGGSESDNWALRGLECPQRNEIITDVIEHHAVLNTCAALEAQGYRVQYLPVDVRGVVCPETLAAAISEKTVLVSVMMANNEVGTVEPIRDLAEIAHGHGAMMHTDAVQAMGHIPVDVRVLGVDLLSASAHKFNGPRGVGFLYIRRGTPMHAFICGGAQERGLRAGTENVAGVVGMATALRKNVDALVVYQKTMKALEERFLDVLGAANVDFRRNGADQHLPGLMSLSFRDAEGEMLLHRMDLKKICIATGAACDSVRSRVSHVIDALGVPDTYAMGTIRVSFGRENTEAEAETVGHALVEILRSLH